MNDWQVAEQCLLIGLLVLGVVFVGGKALIVRLVPKNVPKDLETPSKR